ncbi:uncharacterized protein TNIN_51451 [Trichonephila inaurata madagascariensis]|uniref:Uncharacterized protein n=1 Tax=Trichonephila inaurata madagascariensis TaxID=2747483 RepID=A0A8X7BN85_9ARAC|nr:uncharacterized protein TNIN_51451 [Trichonephila inaurata madagascariensis]
MNGIFHNFHEPSPGLTDWDTASSFSKPSAAQSGTKKKGVGEIMHSPSWGLPEEVGMFGRFIDFDEDVPVVAKSHNVKTSVGEWSEPLYPGMSLELYPKGVSSNYKCLNSFSLHLNSINSFLEMHEPLNFILWSNALMASYKVFI